MAEIDPDRAIIPTETRDAELFQQPSDEDFGNRQLNLFQTFLANNDQEREQLSNAIDLWDSLPRYSVSRQAMTKTRHMGRFLDKHETTFHHRGRNYTCIISPAKITDLDGVERDFYPSASEELVEDALRKLAIEQHAGYFDKSNYRSGVVFTLYELREEMKKRGHARSFQEIVQSLNILSHCIVDIIPHGEGERLATSPCLPSLVASSRSKLRDDPEAKWAVQFHPLVTGAIDQVTHRQYNYHLMMSHNTQLARWLHKQLVLKYTFADFSTDFQMRYSTIKRDSGLLDGYARDRDGVKAVEAAFKALKDSGTTSQKPAVIRDYKRKDETGPRKKLMDVVFTIKPSLEFIREAKAANKRQQIADGKAATANGKR